MTSLHIYAIFIYLSLATIVSGYEPIGQAVSSGIRVLFKKASWHAGLYTKTTRPYKQICGATVITRNAVLTAAHCFTKDTEIPPASRYAVAAGKIYRPYNNPEDKGAQKTDVAEIHIPPRYQGSAANFQDDIAVVIVVTSFEYNHFVQPACVSFDTEFDEVQLLETGRGNAVLATFVGWGETGANTLPSQVLQMITLPTIEISRCLRESPLSFKSAITGDKFCAGYHNGTAVCRGDSGGGLVFTLFMGRKYRLFLRGVASTSPPDDNDNSCNIYTWATFTHLLRHEHFIKTYLPNVETACDEFYGPSTDFFKEHVACCPCSQFSH